MPMLTNSHINGTSSWITELLSSNLWYKLFRICQNETWTRMSKRELAAVFAPILLRPTQENLL